MAGDAFVFVFFADHEAGDVLQKHQRHLALAAQLDEVRALLRTFRKQHAVVGDDADRHAFDVRKTAHQRGAKTRLELMELAAIDDAGDHLVHVIGLARVGRDHAVKLTALIERRHRCAQGLVGALAAVQAGNCLACQRQRVRVVLRQVVGHARQAGVNVAAAQVFGADDLADGGFDQRRAAQKNGALVFDDDGLVTHGRHISAACCATAHDHGNLRDALRAHVGLVVEDAAEVLAVREHVVLVGQVGAARVHQVNAGQIVLHRHFLGTQMLFDCHRVIGAALDSGVVANDQAIDTADAADAGNQTGAGCAVAAVAVRVHGQRGQRRQLQKRRARVQQHLHAFARRQLAARHMFGTRCLATAGSHFGKLHRQVLHLLAQDGCIGLEVGRSDIELGLQN